MHSLRKSNHLKRKVAFMSMHGVDLRACILITFIMMILLWSLVMVAAGSNSNYPAGL